MSIESRIISSHKPPRLSLRTKLISPPQRQLSAIFKSGNGDISPTSLNTVLNAYAFAIENGSPKPGTSCRPKETRNLDIFSSLNLEIPTKSTEKKISPIISTNQLTVNSSNLNEPDKISTQVSTHSMISSSDKLNLSQNRCRNQAVPYIKPQVVRGILRNSSLPSLPLTASTSSSGTRTPVRLPARAKKHVCYKDPLTQTISTYKYVMSHIDLLAEISSCPATDSSIDFSGEMIDSMGKSTEHEKSDVAQLSQSHEHMAQQSPKPRKRKHWETSTKWEWTINTKENDSDCENHSETLPTALKTKVKKIKMPTDRLSEKEIRN
ncbi:hypothetical protein K3495_g7019 [Podosphaera aphanis]|nr:hypothetical protein K3495_g7019 [Podosphaera aphanis]